MRFTILIIACAGKQPEQSLADGETDPQKDRPYTAKQYGETDPPKKNPAAKWPTNKISAYSENGPNFFLPPTAKRGPHTFLPRQRKKVRHKKSGVATSRTLTPAHDARSGIIAKEARRRTAARPISITLVYGSSVTFTTAVTIVFLRGRCIEHSQLLAVRLIV